jgi:deazaflavin-dependent oxidoreductase (nitroreductase family)
MIRKRQAGEPYRWWEKFLLGFAKTRAGTWYGVEIAGRLDPHLMRWTKGRFSLAIGQPVILLHTIGAKTGAPRTNAVFYVRDADDYVIAASNGGAPKHPAWYHNLRAMNEIQVELFGQRDRRVVREAEGPERERLWKKLGTLYEGYDVYDKRAGRKIPVIVLSPSER